jgi:putative membrane protein insertion efficiency factor
MRRAVWICGIPARLALIGLVRLYRVTLSGIAGGQCRYLPSCSHYAEEAIRTRGAVAGSLLAVRRIARCHPWARGGEDPVPARGLHDDIIHRMSTPASPQARP